MNIKSKEAYRPATGTVLLALIFVIGSASAKSPMPAVQPLFQPFALFGIACDAALWDHVYHPNRLIQHGCVTVTGTIVDATHGRHRDGVRHEADGDTHGWLKLDAQYEHLLNNGNKQYEHGNLVFEIVCYFKVSQSDAKPACRGYHASIKVPPVGTHVRMTGTYVQDTNHGRWMEIHPVTAVSPD